MAVAWVEISQNHGIQEYQQMAKPAISDQASVFRRDASFFFNMGRDKFMRRWDEYYKYHIAHAETTNGIRLLLVDVIEAAFPEAPVDVIHQIAYQLLYQPTSCTDLRCATRCLVAGR